MRTARVAASWLGVLGVVGVIVLAAGLHSSIVDPASAAPVTGISARRIVVRDGAGQVVFTLRARAVSGQPDRWERQSPGQVWVAMQVMDQTAHALWIFDAAADQELRIEFPALQVKGRPGSREFPNPNAWQTLPFNAAAYDTPSESPAGGNVGSAPVTGLTVRQFVLKSSGGSVVSVYRQRAGPATPATWEAQEPGSPWRGPIQVVDRSAYVLWLYDPTDRAELKIDFPSLAVKGRPGSDSFPNMAAWNDLPVTAEVHAGAPVQDAPGADPAPSPLDGPPESGGPDDGGARQAVTFHVRNDLPEPVELAQADAPESVVDIIRPQQTGTYQVVPGITWLVRRAGDKTELKRVVVSRDNQLVTLEGATPPGPEAPFPPPESGGEPGMPPVPEPHDPAGAAQTETLTLTGTVSLLGGWPHLSGDPDMDTDGRDRVPIVVKSRLKYSEEGVYVDVFFHIREFRGDGTAYGGRWTTVDLFTHRNGKIPADARVVDVRARGGTERTFRGMSVGKQHGLLPINTHGTYWDTMSVRVDTSKRGDGAHVGVAGQVTVDVVIVR